MKVAQAKPPGAISKPGKALTAASPLPGVSVAASAERGAHVQGSRVQLVGLQSCKELNGKTGTLLDFDESRARWRVQLDGGDVKQVKATNVVGVSELDAMARIRELEAQLARERQAHQDALAKQAQPGKASAPSSRKRPLAGAAGGPAGQQAADAADGAPAAKCLKESEASSPGAAAGKSPAEPEAASPKELTPPVRASGKAKTAQAKARAGKAAAATKGPPAKAKSAVDGASGKQVKSQVGAKTSAATPPPSTANGTAAPAQAAGAEAGPAPVRRRMRWKGQTLAEAPVAVLLQKLASSDDPAGEEPALRSTMDEKELRALEGDDRRREELDGDQRSGGKTSKKQGGAKGVADTDGDDDDNLLDEDSDLEGEEAISDLEDEDELDQDDDDDAVAEAWQNIGALAYPDVWIDRGGGMARPGDEGFNAYAASCIEKAKLGTSESPFAGLGLRLHQESAVFLVHPAGPIRRLLVDHATGTGKTFIMLRLLDSFFDDPRPKVAIFPKDRVCDNFYMELLKWPSRWRDFFAASRPDAAALACGSSFWKRKRNEVWDIQNAHVRNEAKRRNIKMDRVIREVVDAIREVLEMKRSIRRGKVKPNVALRFRKEHPGVPVPRAPLRAFRYTTAGGGACELGRDGWPRSPILKVGFDAKELNPYSAKVVIMDECHNLVRPTQKFEEQLGRLRDHLMLARGTVLAGFTGTPVGNDASEGRRLLDVIKGEDSANKTDEGFVSSFHARGSADFPREEPVAGIPDGVLHEGMYPQLLKGHSLHGEALKRYIMKEAEFQVTPRLLRMPEEKRMAKLSQYCNMHIYYGNYGGKHREALLKDPKDHAPKFYAVARTICKNKEKAVIMLTRETGFKAMLEVMRRLAKKANFKVATLDELGDFNDARKNLRGERYRVMVVETSQAGEGVQFRHVRRIHLVDVPMRHSDLVQRTSRCVRLGGHADLPPEERSLAVEMHVAQYPKFLRQGPGSLIYRELLNAKEVHNTPGPALEAATSACLTELKTRSIKTLMDFQVELQKEGGVKFIELLTETALEHLGALSKQPVRAMAMALWRLRRGGDDLELLEGALLRQHQTADELLVEELADKSSELLPPLEAMRFNAVDRQLLAPLGDPPRAPPPRSDAVQQRVDAAMAGLEAVVAPVDEGAAAADLVAEADEDDDEDFEDEEDDGINLAELEEHLAAEGKGPDADDMEDEEEDEEDAGDEEVAG